MNTYFVYILKCSDDSFYIGVTNNLEIRLSQHESGLDIYAFTYNKRPLVLVYQESYSDINQAILREKQLKGWSRKKKEALIDGDLELLKVLSKNNQ
ncbi:MAG: GIY-YIG nuclease family protein [Bacteroidia bacterium]